ncbi:threonine/serine ThrE exporter family protein [Demequina gelatinilytica]|uniref:threonine/serine ThrE exporter family protein n=1 Tax=Demequina gelatinilytica TaxID=1638980 RepID=UPI000782634C|nr:threonine/serine exporter family protein [Demequina gelatinilytica]
MADPAAEHRDPEHSLEPVGLIGQSGAILRMGRMMLAAGTASYRVKEAMGAVAHALGVDRHTAAVTLTEITATTHRGAIFRTEVTEVRKFGVNAERIKLLDDFRSGLPEHITVEEVHAELDRIEARPALYPAVANALSAGAACAAFGVLNNARPLEVIAVLVAATAGQFLRRALAHRGFNPFGTTLVAAALACGLYLASVALYGAFGLGVDVHASGYIACTLFLLPGFPLITAALDMAKLDFSAGISRLVFATMMIVGAALSVWGITLIGALDASTRAPIPLDAVPHYAMMAAASFVGVLGFAFMFNSPVRMAVSAALIGMVSNTARLYMADHGVMIQMATVLACVLVGVLVALAAPRTPSPIITLQVPAVLVMIPGVLAFQSVVSLNEGDYTATIGAILQVVLVVLSIMVGLVIAKLFTDRQWAFDRG